MRPRSNLAPHHRQFMAHSFLWLTTHRDPAGVSRPDGVSINHPLGQRRIGRMELCNAERAGRNSSQSIRIKSPALVRACAIGTTPHDLYPWVIRPLVGRADDAARRYSFLAPASRCAQTAASHQGNACGVVKPSSERTTVAGTARCHAPARRITQPRPDAQQTTGAGRTQTIGDRDGDAYAMSSANGTDSVAVDAVSNRYESTWRFTTWNELMTGRIPARPTIHPTSYRSVLAATAP